MVARRVKGGKVEKSVHHGEVIWLWIVSRTSEIVGDVGSDIGSVRGPESAIIGIVAALEVASAAVTSSAI